MKASSSLRYCMSRLSSSAKPSASARPHPDYVPQPPSREYAPPAMEPGESLRPGEHFRPRRVTLVRHGESEGNIDPTVYASIADNCIELTPRGRLQADMAGRELRAMIPEGEKITFFVSPYTRTWQTYEEIAKYFSPNDVVTKEEPRLREQDFGNFQDVSKIIECRRERHQFGSFYYRFPQGESGADVLDRLSTFVADLQTMYRDRACTPYHVLVSHGITSRLYLMRMFEWRVGYYERTKNLTNGQLVHMTLQEDTGRYRLDSMIGVREPLARRTKPPLSSASSSSSAPSSSSTSSSSSSSSYRYAASAANSLPQRRERSHASIVDSSRAGWAFY